jgi:hypothetical protein
VIGGGHPKGFPGRSAVRRRCAADPGGYATSRTGSWFFKPREGYLDPRLASTSSYLERNCRNGRSRANRIAIFAALEGCCRVLALKGGAGLRLPAQVTVGWGFGVLVTAMGATCRVRGGRPATGC